MLLNEGRGSGVVARQQVRQLQALGHELTLIHPRVRDDLPGVTTLDVPLPGEVMPVHEFLPSAADGQKAVSTMSFEEAADFLPTYRATLESVIDDVDIVVAHHGNLVAIAAAEVCGAHGKPYVLFLHGTGVEPRLHGGYDDRLWAHIEASIRGAAGVIVTTDYVRDHLVLPLVDLPEERFLVLPCGIDLQEFHVPDGPIAPSFDLPARYVICPGALTEAKGPQNVVAASREYADLAPTVFIGDGNLREELERELADRGRFLGFVSIEDKAELINHATVLVAAPEKKEHFGIIYAEALAGGTPCVAYSGGGVDSIVTPDVGILTERTPEALGRAVRRLLEAEPTRLAMSARARPRAEQFYDAERLGATLSDWLANLVA